MESLDNIRHSIDDLRGSEALSYHEGKSLLESVIVTADAVRSPPGDPGRVEAIAENYAAHQPGIMQTTADFASVSRGRLPEVWRSKAGTTASESVESLMAPTIAIGSVLQHAEQAMREFADKLATVAAIDRKGRELMSEAKDKLVFSSLFTMVDFPEREWHSALDLASQGCARRRRAIDQYVVAATDLLAALRELTARLPGHKSVLPGIGALDSVGLAYAHEPNTFSLQPIMSGAASARAQRRLDELSESERREFEAMLAAAKSPAEAAYLLKALGADSSYTMADIKEFRDLIHAHGDDPAWLTTHLGPPVHRQGDYAAGNTSVLGYGGEMTADGFDFYSQQDNPTCTPASLTVARAATDPVYMLSLTTGQGPGDRAEPGTVIAPGDDSPAIVNDRLLDAYQDVHETDRINTDVGGTARTDIPHVADQVLGPTVDGEFRRVELTDEAARSDILAEVEAAVASGTPVPFSVDGEDSGHTMLITDADSENLMVYNPWGTTGAVAKDDFVRGDIGDLAGDLDLPTNIYLPRDVPPRPSGPGPHPV